MELKAKRPFLLGARVIVEGESFETTDPHGNELVIRGIADPAKAAKAKAEAADPADTTADEKAATATKKAAEPKKKGD